MTKNNNSKLGRWAYWISTAVLAAIYVAGGLMYLGNISGIQTIFGTLGYPAYLVPILAVVKLLGAAAILLRVSAALTDLAYAGMFYHLLLALSAHINAGDHGFVPAIVGLVMLAISFLTQNAARARKSAYAPAVTAVTP